MKLTPIAYIRTDFPEKFGLPRQSGVISELSGRIVFEKKYRTPDALRGLEGFSHVWLIWGFSEGFASRGAEISSEWSPTVRPPRLGGNKRVGVFATRSPNRPNPIGLSCVRLDGIREDGENGTVLEVSGIDMTDMTPIYDIKPYLPHADCIPEACGGFAEAVNGRRLSVSFAEGVGDILTEEKRAAIVRVLEEDPRPQYRADDAVRMYTMSFAEYEVEFSVSGTEAVVASIVRRESRR